MIHLETLTLEEVSFTRPSTLRPRLARTEETSEPDPSTYVYLECFERGLAEHCKQKAEVW